MFQDVGDGRDGAAVGWGVAQVVEGVGEGVRLELQADLDNVQRGYDEAAETIVSARTLSWEKQSGRTNREMRPAKAPAETTCNREPSSLRRAPPGVMHLQSPRPCGRAQVSGSDWNWFTAQRCCVA